MEQRRADPHSAICRYWLTTIGLQRRHLRQDAGIQRGCEHLCLNAGSASASRFSAWPRACTLGCVFVGSSATQVSRPSVTTRLERNYQALRSGFNIPPACVVGEETATSARALGWRGTGGEVDERNQPTAVRGRRVRLVGRGRGPRRRPSGGIADESESSPGTLVMRRPAAVSGSAASVLEDLWRRNGSSVADADLRIQRFALVSSAVVLGGAPRIRARARRLLLLR